MACDTRAGSAASSGGGARDVFTAQKLHPRVHVSPISMMVAVEVPSLPPQQVPILGHLASSHTVARLSFFTEVRIDAKASACAPVGALTFSHSGFRSRGGGGGVVAAEGVDADNGAEARLPAGRKASKSGASASNLALMAARRSDAAAADAVLDPLPLMELLTACEEEGREPFPASAAAVTSVRARRRHRRPALRRGEVSIVNKSGGSAGGGCRYGWQAACQRDWVTGQRVTVLLSFFWNFPNSNLQIHASSTCAQPAFPNRGRGYAEPADAAYLVIHYFSAMELSPNYWASLVPDYNEDDLTSIYFQLENSSTRADARPDDIGMGFAVDRTMGEGGGPASAAPRVMYDRAGPGPRPDLQQSQSPPLTHAHAPRPQPLLEKRRSDSLSWFAPASMAAATTTTVSMDDADADGGGIGGSSLHHRLSQLPPLSSANAHFPQHNHPQQQHSMQLLQQQQQHLYSRRYSEHESEAASSSTFPSDSAGQFVSAAVPTKRGRGRPSKAAMAAAAAALAASSGAAEGESYSPDSSGVGVSSNGDAPAVSTAAANKNRRPSAKGRPQRATRPSSSRGGKGHSMAARTATFSPSDSGDYGDDGRSGDDDRSPPAAAIDTLVAALAADDSIDVQQWSAPSPRGVAAGTAAGGGGRYGEADPGGDDPSPIATYGNNSGGGSNGGAMAGGGGGVRGGAGGGSGASGKRKRFLWTEELHTGFIAALFDYGVRNATPKTLFDLMQPCDPSMTSDHIKSHLQKYRANSKAGRDMFLEEYKLALEDAVRRADMEEARTGVPPFPVQFSTYALPPAPAAARAAAAAASGAAAAATVGGRGRGGAASASSAAAPARNGGAGGACCARCVRLESLMRMGVGVEEGEGSSGLPRSASGMFITTPQPSPVSHSSDAAMPPASLPHAGAAAAASAAATSAASFAPTVVSAAESSKASSSKQAPAAEAAAVPEAWQQQQPWLGRPQHFLPPSTSSGPPVPYIPATVETAPPLFPPLRVPLVALRVAATAPQPAPQQRLEARVPSPAAAHRDLVAAPSSATGGMVPPPHISMPSVVGDGVGGASGGAASARSSGSNNSSGSSDGDSGGGSHGSHVSGVGGGGSAGASNGSRGARPRSHTVTEENGVGGIGVSAAATAAAPSVRSAGSGPQGSAASLKRAEMAQVMSRQMRMHSTIHHRAEGQLLQYGGSQVRPLIQQPGATGSNTVLAPDRQRGDVTPTTRMAVEFLLGGAAGVVEDGPRGSSSSSSSSSSSGIDTRSGGGGGPSDRQAPSNSRRSSMGGGDGDGDNDEGTLASATPNIITVVLPTGQFNSSSVGGSGASGSGSSMPPPPARPLPALLVPLPRSLQASLEGSNSSSSGNVHMLLTALSPLNTTGPSSSPLSRTTAAAATSAGAAAVVVVVGASSAFAPSSSSSSSGVVAAPGGIGVGSSADDDAHLRAVLDALERLGHDEDTAADLSVPGSSRTGGGSGRTSLAAGGSGEVFSGGSVGGTAVAAASAAVVGKPSVAYMAVNPAGAASDLFSFLQ